MAFTPLSGGGGDGGSGGGGDAESHPRQAWVETAANGGSDVTGEVADPALPFATVQAAFNAVIAVSAGTVVIHLGAGVHGNLAIAGGPQVVSLIGKGLNVSFIGNITYNTTGDFTIQDVGQKSVSIQSISSAGAIGDTGGEDEDGGSGGNGGNIRGYGLFVGGDVTSAGGRGGNGGPTGVGDTNGGSGGTGGSIVLEDCEVDGMIISAGGNGGDGDGSIGATSIGGNGGAAGDVTLRNVLCLSDLFATGGNGGSGDTGGSQGAGGVVTATFSEWVDGSADGNPQGTSQVDFCIYGSLTGLGGSDNNGNIIGGNFTAG